MGKDDQEDEGEGVVVCRNQHDEWLMKGMSRREDRNGNWKLGCDEVCWKAVSRGSYKRGE